MTPGSRPSDLLGQHAPTPVPVPDRLLPDLVTPVRTRRVSRVAVLVGSVAAAVALIVGVARLLPAQVVAGSATTETAGVTVSASTSPPASPTASATRTSSRTPSATRSSVSVTSSKASPSSAASLAARTVATAPDGAVYHVVYTGQGIEQRSWITADGTMYSWRVQSGAADSYSKYAGTDSALVVVTPARASAWPTDPQTLYAYVVAQTPNQSVATLFKNVVEIMTTSTDMMPMGQRKAFASAVALVPGVTTTTAKAATGQACALTTLGSGVNAQWVCLDPTTSSVVETGTGVRSSATTQSVTTSEFVSQVPADVVAKAG